MFETLEFSLYAMARVCQASPLWASEVIAAWLRDNKENRGYKVTVHKNSVCISIGGGTYGMLCYHAIDEGHGYGIYQEAMEGNATSRHVFSIGNYQRYHG